MGLAPARFSGSAKKVGSAYASHYQREIAGFFTKEFASYSYSKRFVGACLKATREQSPLAADFLNGMAESSLLSIEQRTLLMLHEEELYHRRLNRKLPHCSAVGGIGSKGAVVGQNWDWSTSYLPWSSTNRFAIKGHPSAIALSYPGLPICAGLNSSGLALMWTGAGYYPPLEPRVGVPTYAIVLELLFRKDVSSALKYLRRVGNAGAFIFLLGDKSGNFAVVEATPGRIFIERPHSISRANLYELPAAILASEQKPPGLKRCHSLKRQRIFAKSFEPLSDQLTVGAIKSILSEPDILIDDRTNHATLMQLVADCGRGVLMVRPWRTQNRRWQVLRP